MLFPNSPPKWGMLEKVNLLLLKAVYPADGFLQVFFKEFTVVGHLKSLDMLSQMRVL